MGIRVDKLRILRYEEGRHGRGSVRRWFLSPLKCFFQITTFFQARFCLGRACGVYSCSFYCFYNNIIVSLKVFVFLDSLL